MANKADGNKRRTIKIDPVWNRFMDLPNGHFEALVALDSNYKPDYMTILGQFSPGVLKVSLQPCELLRLQADERVLSAELREYIAGAQT